jgi:hypothetical protein
MEEMDARARPGSVCCIICLLLCSILVYLIVIILYDFGRRESTLDGRLCGVGTCNEAMVCFVPC